MEAVSGENLGKLREKYCYWCSTLILHHPVFSCEYDVVGKMWMNSLYKHINTLRKLISRARKQKNKSNMASFEQELNHFCDTQSLHMYNEIQRVYEKIIRQDVDNPSQSQDLDNDEDSFKASEQNFEEKQKAAVKVLFKVYIQMGDLHRYSKQFVKAEKFYEMASKIGPGIGNAFNQLAVVAQEDPIKKLLLALYYYVRSDCASHQRFEVSNRNINFLMRNNNKWLLANDSEWLGNGKGIETPESEPRETTPQLFLSRFVELLFDLREHRNLSEFGDRCNRCFQDLPVILEKTAGDPLLCKMVAVNAFVAIDKDKVHARTFGLRFGLTLATRVDILVEVMIKKMVTAKDVKGLLPLLYFAEYESSLGEPEICSNKSFEEVNTSFWKMMCQIANRLVAASDDYGLGDEDVEEKMPKEYADMSGFKPFCSFIPAEDAYASVKEAAALIGSTSMTQEPSKSNFDYRVKLARVLWIMKSLEGKKVRRNDGGTYSEISEQRDELLPLDNARVDDENGDGSVFEDENDDDAAAIMNDEDETETEADIETQNLAVPQKRGDHHQQQNVDDIVADVAETQELNLSLGNAALAPENPFNPASQIEPMAGRSQAETQQQQQEEEEENKDGESDEELLPSRPNPGQSNISSAVGNGEVAETGEKDPRADHGSGQPQSVLPINSQTIEVVDSSEAGEPAEPKLATEYGDISEQIESDKSQSRQLNTQAPQPERVLPATLSDPNGSGGEPSEPTSQIMESCYDVPRSEDPDFEQAKPVGHGATDNSLTAIEDTADEACVSGDPKTAASQLSGTLPPSLPQHGPRQEEGLQAEAGELDLCMEGRQKVSQKRKADGELKRAGSTKHRSRKQSTNTACSLSVPITGQRSGKRAMKNIFLEIFGPVPETKNPFYNPPPSDEEETIEPEKEEQKDDMISFSELLDDVYGQPRTSNPFAGPGWDKV